jgi:thiol-disulfide isomerase/thioredoxin
VDAAGFARHTELIDGLESAAALKIVLEPERIVHLEIAGDDGKPVAQANIECLDDVERDFRHMITDDAGKATIRGLPFKANALEIRLSHASYVADMAFDRTVMLPTDAAESTHKLTMSRAATLTGKVLDAATKKPLSGARLIVGAVLDDRQPKAFSDPDGAFRLEGVPPGEAVITVHLAEHSPQLEIVRLAAGQEASLDVLMSAGKSIHGVVTGPEGKKLSGAYVNATRWRNQETLGLRAITDDDGRFEILDAPTDEFEVAVYLAGFKPLTAQKIAADQKDVSFAMEGDPRGGKPGEEQPSWKSGEDAPPLTLTTLDGASWKLADLRGKVILIDFWATWCGPCVAEIPNLTAVYEQHKANPNFVMLSVSLDESDAPVRKFTKARGMSWTHAAGGKSGAQDAATAYRVRGIPAIFIIDKSGKIAAAEVRGGGIAAAVQQALGSAGE